MELHAASSDTWEKVLFLFLGWLLGMLSPIVVDAIRRRREVKEVKKALLTELSDLQSRLANTVWLMSIRTGQYNRSFLEWFKPIIERNRYLHKLDNVLKSTTSHLEMSDEQLAVVAAHLSASEKKGLGLKTHHAPLLDSKVGQLGSFPVEFQSILLEIHSRLIILNEEIEQYRFYFQQTFSSGISDINHTLIVENIEGTYRAVQQQARMICDFIDRATKPIM